MNINYILTSDIFTPVPLCPGHYMTMEHAGLQESPMNNPFSKTYSTSISLCS